MAIKKNTFNDYVLKHLHAAIKDKITSIAIEEEKEAMKRINKRISESLDALALSVAAEYSFQDMGNHLVIHIKKPNVERK